MNLSIRLLTADDLPFADSLRALAGWNQTPKDWRRFLDMEPEGCFLAISDGTPAGIVTTHIHTVELAWIGMALVHPDYRRRGIGKALLNHAIHYLQARNVACIKLDATPLGQKVYESIGFKEEWTLSRWAGIGLCQSKYDPSVAKWTEANLGEIAQLDLAAFGISRTRLVQALALQAQNALVMRADDGEIQSFGFLRAGTIAHYLGPVVAVSSDAARPLIQALLNERPHCKTFWDIPDQNLKAAELAQTFGFQKVRSLTRMFFGENSCCGNTQMQFAIAAPEVG